MTRPDKLSCPCCGADVLAGQLWCYTHSLPANDGRLIRVCHIEDRDPATRLVACEVAWGWTDEQPAETCPSCGCAVCVGVDRGHAVGRLVCEDEPCPQAVRTDVQGESDSNATAAVQRH